MDYCTYRGYVITDMPTCSRQEMKDADNAIEIDKLYRKMRDEAWHLPLLWFEEDE